MATFNAAELRAKNTLTLAGIECPDGTTQTWTVPPFSAETERSFWAWMERQERHRQEQLEARLRRETPPKMPTKAEAWSELLALAVKDPVLDAEHLAATFDVLALQDLGEAVQSFFLRRTLPGDESPEAPTPLSPA